MGSKGQGDEAAVPGKVQTLLGKRVLTCGVREQVQRVDHKVLWGGISFMTKTYKYTRKSAKSSGKEAKSNNCTTHPKEKSSEYKGWRTVF